jgi:hypothetical protein
MYQGFKKIQYFMEAKFDNTDCRGFCDSKKVAYQGLPTI